MSNKLSLNQVIIINYAFCVHRCTHNIIILMEIIIIIDIDKQCCLAYFASFFQASKFKQLDKEFGKYGPQFRVDQMIRYNNNVHNITKHVTILQNNTKTEFVVLQFTVTSTVKVPINNFCGQSDGLRANSQQCFRF